MPSLGLPLGGDTVGGEEMFSRQIAITHRLIITVPDCQIKPDIRLAPVPRNAPGPMISRAQMKLRNRIPLLGPLPYGLNIFGRDSGFLRHSDPDPAANNTKATRRTQREQHVRKTQEERTWRIKRENL